MANDNENVLFLINDQIATEHARYKTMDNMILDSMFKRTLAKEGLFYHEHTLKCIGCYVKIKKINTKTLKRHTYSKECIVAINLLRHNKHSRKQSFKAFKAGRVNFKSPLLVDMLVERGFYTFGVSNQIKCSNCLVVFKYTNVHDAQQHHCKDCIFLNVNNNTNNDNDNNNVNDNDDDDNDDLLKKVTQWELSPPQNFNFNNSNNDNDNVVVVNAVPSAPPMDLLTTILECKICFDREKTVCFIPCRHLAVCDVCARKCKKCCICNANIEQKIITLPQ
jgi:hypothetical protein